MTPGEYALLAEDRQRESAIVRESGVIGSIELPDPYVVMLVSGYYANLPQYTVESVYRRNGQHYVDVSPAGRSAFEPCDVTTYRVAVVERCLRGEDVEVLSFEEVAWADGSKRYLRGEEP